MGSGGGKYFYSEDRRRSSESELFAQVAAELQRRTKLNDLEARGTLSLALKVAGHLTRDVGPSELLQTVSTVLSGELRSRGVDDAGEVCAAIESLLRR